MSSQYEPTITPEMKARYVARRSEDLTKLEVAFTKCDFHTLRAIAHQIKGNAATFSFEDLEAAAVALESAAETESLDLCREPIALIRAWLQRQS